MSPKRVVISNNDQDSDDLDMDMEMDTSTELSREDVGAPVSRGNRE